MELSNKTSTRGGEGGQIMSLKEQKNSKGYSTWFGRGSCSEC